MLSPGVSPYRNKRGAKRKRSFHFVRTQFLKSPFTGAVHLIQQNDSWSMWFFRKFRKNARKVFDSCTDVSQTSSRAQTKIIACAVSFCLCSHQESNLDFLLRREMSYPLNDKSEREGKYRISYILIFFERAPASFAPKSNVDLARIELAPLQCECSIVPLDYRPERERKYGMYVYFFRERSLKALLIGP